MLAGKGAAQRPDRFRWHPHRLDAEVAADLDDQSGDRRVEVHVLVRVDMVEREAGRAKGRELRANFGRQLAADLRQKEKTHASAHHIAVELAAAPHQTGNFGRRQQRAAVDQIQMQPDMQIGQAAGARHRVRRFRRADHQARGRQNAVPMRLFDRRVDRAVEPEIVGANDELLQASSLALGRPEPAATARLCVKDSRSRRHKRARGAVRRRRLKSDRSGASARHLIRLLR